mmetsp:Transcript_37429/g.99021  ORF Transcript_37429/g.99021 Transcript_37429/m.99021 type:complete len:273 (-) Transcript_37429:246-1064(-)
MPRVVGRAEKVVDFEGLTIEEYAGNVATKEDRISIAHVQVREPSSEPWLTLDYDEWMCVLKGRMVLLHEGGEPMEVKTGETVFIARGERFRPTFPEGGTEYVPVCLPAFRPDRCIREEEEGDVSKKLKTLHGKPKTVADPPEVLYHMCPASRWEACKSAGIAMFPPTFEADDFLTHATAVPSRLVTTANHFYQDVEGEWICLRFTRSALRRHGIFVRDEHASPVGGQAVGDDWGEWVCPHVIGGLPPAVVDKEFPMARDGKKFLGITGLTDA